MVEKAIKIEWRLKRRGQGRSYPSYTPFTSRNIAPKREERVSGSSTLSRLKPDPIKTKMRSNSKPTNDASKMKNRDAICLNAKAEDT